MAAAKHVTVPDAPDAGVAMPEPRPAARRVGLTELLLVINAGLMGGVLWKLHVAEQRVGRWEAPISRLADFGLDVAAASDSVVRLFNGGIPGKLSDLLCGDIAGTAAKVEGLATRAERSLLKAATTHVPANGQDGEGYPHFARLARVFSVMKEASAIAKNIKPLSSCTGATSEGANGQITGSGGLVMEPLSYAIDFISNQTDPTSAQWRSVAQQCSELGQSLAGLNWAGDYDCYKCCVDEDWCSWTDPSECNDQYTRDHCPLKCNACPPGTQGSNFPCGLLSCSWSAQHAITDPGKPVQQVAQWCGAFMDMAPQTPPTPPCLAKLKELCGGQQTPGAACLTCVLDHGSDLSAATCDNAMEKTWCGVTQAFYDSTVAGRRA